MTRYQVVRICTNRDCKHPIVFVWRESDVSPVYEVCPTCAHSEGETAAPLVIPHNDDPERRAEAKRMSGAAHPIAGRWHKGAAR